MLSVGSRDGSEFFERRKNGLGLGFGGGDEMEETELEEGEACYYQDDDTSFDPDTDLSYIDVRIQDILGHFQKDFEGGVSAENLGAKFGDYGSFLPTYQRSPSIWSHPKYPQRPQSCSTKSPTTIPFEGLRQSSAVRSNAAIPVRPVAASNNAVAGPVASFTRKSAKIDVCASAAQSAGVFSPKCEPMAESVNGTDQKTLKLRIKVSSDNVSAMRNAEIYSGLGLDVSPSSTLEESSDDSGMLSPTIRDAPDESPMTMVQIMTSSQIPGGCLLSPLSDFLLHLKEKDKPLLKDSKPRILQKSHQGGTSMIDSESPAVTDKGQSEKKLRAVEKNARSSESKNTDRNVVEDGIDNLLRKEIDIETPSGRGLVNSALKIPLLSSSRSTHEKSERQNYTETVKDSSDGTSVSSKEPSRGLVKDIVFSSDSVKEEIFDSSSHHEIAAPLKGKLNSKSSSAEKVPEDKKASSHKDQKFDPRKNGRGKIGIQSDASKEQKNSHKVASNEQGRVKKKSKGSQSNGTVGVELPKEKLKISSFIPPKEKKKHSKEYFSETQLEAVKPKKESSKTSGKGGSMGDLKMGPADSMIDSLHGYHKNKAKDSKVENLEREHHRFAEKSKGRPIGKKIENLSAFDTHTENVAVAPAAMGTGPISDAVTGPVVPVLIQDNWVCCDSCEKWRLLPYGIDPDQLPKKWLCSMQTWLPGMNNCSYSEDETTGALYQVPVSQNSIQSQHDGAVSGITLADVQHIDQSQRPSMALSGVQKKNATKDISNAPSLTTPTHLPNSSKKNQQSPLKSRSLNDVNQFTLDPSHRNRTGLQHSVNPNEFAVEKQRHKQTEKHELLGRYSDGGNYIGNIGKLSKTKSKRESEQDGSRISKKIKTEGLFYTDGDRNGYSSSKFSKSNTRESSLAPGKLLKDPEGQASLDCQYKENLKATDAWEFDKMALSTKKRKVKQWQEGQVYPDAQMSRAHMPETSESERRKEKKPKLSKPEAKESSTSKAGRVTKILISGSRDPLSDAVEEESRGADEKKHQPGQCRETKPVSEVVDSLKKDSGYALQPALAATSSSSKISGSRKTKANFEEVKGSPVESVSSSPFRISNSDKLTNARRNLLGKDNATIASFSIIGSPRRCSDVEYDGGSDRSGIARKEKTSSSVIDSLGAQKTTDALVSNGTNTDPSPSKFEDHCVGNVAASSEQHNWGKPDNHYHANGSSQGKSGKFSSSRSREKQRGTKSDFDNGEIKVSDSFSDEQVDPFVTKSAVSLRYEGDAESHGHSVFYEEARDAKYGFPGKCTFKSDKDEKHFLDQKELKSKWFREDKRENRSKIGTHENSDVRFSPSLPKQYKDTNSRGGKMGTGRSKELKSHLQKNSQHMLSREDEKKLLLPSMVKHETQSRRSHHVISTPHKGSRSEAFAADAPGGDLTKVSKQPRKPDSQDEVQDGSLRHSTPNGLACRNASAPSPPIRKDISGQAAANNALKEAKDLKHTADRLKNGGADLESTSLYFQAALKFLHGASLLEPCNVESAKNGETTQSMLVYTDTAKLCDFCAHEYERCREMASAAMAYKCMEVARMRVVFSKHWIASKDRRELQAALQVVPPGDSPSSSASDLDNLNNHGFSDKVPVAKGVVASPQVASSHIIVAQNRPNFLRMLNYAQDVNSAMEAMTRSQSAFAAASGNSEDSRYGREGLSAVRRVLEFNFHDVEGLLRLVRLAMEVISR